MPDDRDRIVIPIGTLTGAAAAVAAGQLDKSFRETRTNVRRTRTNTGTVKRTVRPYDGLVSIDGWIKHQKVRLAAMGPYERGLAESMIFSHATVGAQVLRRRRRLTFEMDRAAKTREAIEGLVASRRTPWYRRWWSRMVRNQYFAGGGKRRR